MKVLSCFKTLVYLYVKGKERGKRREVSQRQNENLAPQFSEYIDGISKHNWE